jgi:methionine-rich copper-binding protein CopC
MLEQQGNALIAIGVFIASKVGATGLTVTCDVYEDTTRIITDGNCVEIGGGAYKYTLASGSVDANALYLFIFKTATPSVDQQYVHALWVVGRTWVTRIDDEVSSRAAPGDEMSLESGAIDLSTLSLDVATQIGSVAETDITLRRGDTWVFTATVLGHTWVSGSKMRMVAKYIRNYAVVEDTDAVIIIQLTHGGAAGDGLTRLNKTAQSGANLALGALTRDSSTAIGVTLEAGASYQISSGDYKVEFQLIEPDGDVVTIGSGTYTVIADVDRSIS